MKTKDESLEMLNALMAFAIEKHGMHIEGVVRDFVSQHPVLGKKPISYDTGVQIEASTPIERVAEKRKSG